MTEDLRQKQIRLTKELAQVKAQTSNLDAKLKPSKDFSVGLPRDTTHKAKPVSSPDVIILPPKRKGNKEYIPF